MLRTVVTRQYERPLWCGEHDEPTDYYLVCDGSFACPVRNGVAVTVLVPGMIGAELRAAKNERRRGRRGYRRALKVNEQRGATRRERKEGQQRRDHGFDVV